MDETLIQMIESAFSDVELGDEYTLLEEDFYDYGGVRRHFDQLGSDPFKVYISVDLGVDFIELKQVILDMPYWPESSKLLALTSLETRQKAKNQFNSWKDISLEYLDAHRAVVFLSPKAFQYYLPSAMTIFIKNNGEFESCEFFSSFVFCLLNTSNLSIDSTTSLNTAQLRCVCFFLEYYAVTPYTRQIENINLAIQRFNLKIKALESTKLTVLPHSNLYLPH